MRHGSIRFVLGIALFVLGLAGAPRIQDGFRYATATARLLAATAPEHLPMPVAGVGARDIRDSWGAPRPGGRRHQGIDIFAPRGRAILSTTEGVVLKVGHNTLGGNVVWVLGPGGQSHYYAHLDTFGPIRRGQLIPAGSLLGTVGNSGNARGTPSHLHYGIYNPGGAFNPYPLLVSGSADRVSRHPKRRI